MCLLLRNVCFILLNKQKFLGLSNVLLSRDASGVSSIPTRMPSPPAISQNLCGSPRHRKSLFVVQELQPKHLLLKNKLTYLLDHLSNSKSMKESRINLEDIRVGEKKKR